jgi:hypothetical protein
LILLQNPVLKKKSLMFCFRLCNLSPALQKGAAFSAKAQTQRKQSIISNQSLAI